MAVSIVVSTKHTKVTDGHHTDRHHTTTAGTARQWQNVHYLAEFHLLYKFLAIFPRFHQWTRGLFHKTEVGSSGVHIIIIVIIYFVQIKTFITDFLKVNRSPDSTEWKFVYGRAWTSCINGVCSLNAMRLPATAMYTTVMQHASAVQCGLRKRKRSANAINSRPINATCILLASASVPERACLPVISIFCRYH